MAEQGQGTYIMHSCIMHSGSPIECCLCGMQVAAPFSSSSDGTIGVDASFVGFGDPAGDTLGGSTGFVEDGSDFGALNNDGGGLASGPQEGRGKGPGA